MSYRDQWLSSCFGTSNAEKIEVTFRNGKTVNYTANIMELLKTDKTVQMIVSLETGELYFERDNAGNVVYNA